jgi:DNA-binding transcriptional ArsR family regulator
MTTGAGNVISADPLSPEVAELIARRFGALAEPMRLRILDALRMREEASVGTLAEALDARHGTISKHLNMLYGQKILGRRRDGTSVLYRITDPVVFRLCEEVCGALGDELARYRVDTNPPPLLAGEEAARR